MAQCLRIEENSNLQPLHIAILDDEPFMRELLSEMLTEQGHQVLCFVSARELLTRLAQRSYDVILTDINMPGMSGLDFYAQVAQRHFMQAERILFISGDLSEQTIRFMEQTGSLYLLKPFRQEALFARIQQLRQRNLRTMDSRQTISLLPKAA